MIVRKWIALFAVCMLGAATAAPVHLGVQIKRSSFDLLDPVAIDVLVDNTNKGPVDLHFQLPTEYQIDITSGNDVVWSTIPLRPQPVVHYPVHDHTIPPGASPLAIYEWNAIERDGTTSPLPGDYIVRVKLLELKSQPTATARIHFIAPTPISAIAKLKIGDTITVGGQLDDTHQVLTDSSGSTTLPRRLLGPLASGPIVVRGNISARPDGTRFISILRWATLGSNQALPEPKPTPS